MTLLNIYYKVQTLYDPSERLLQSSNVTLTFWTLTTNFKRYINLLNSYYKFQTLHYPSEHLLQSPGSMYTSSIAISEYPGCPTLPSIVSCKRWKQTWNNSFSLLRIVYVLNCNGSKFHIYIFKVNYILILVRQCDL